MLYTGTPTRRGNQDKGKSIADTMELDSDHDVSKDEHGYIERTSGISKGKIILNPTL